MYKDLKLTYYCEITFKCICVTSIRILLLVGYDWSFLVWWNCPDIHLIGKFVECKLLHVSSLILRWSNNLFLVLWTTLEKSINSYQMNVLKIVIFSFKDNKRITTLLEWKWKTCVSVFWSKNATIHHRKGLSNNV